MSSILDKLLCNLLERLYHPLIAVVVFPLGTIWDNTKEGNLICNVIEMVNSLLFYNTEGNYKDCFDNNDD